MSDESMDMIETEYEVTIFSTGKELYSAVDTLYENNNSLVEEECIETSTISSSGTKNRDDRDSNSKEP